MDDPQADLQDRTGLAEGEEPARGLVPLELALLQRQLIGRLLVEPEQIGVVLERGLRPAHLDGLREQRCLRGIQGVWQAGGSVDMASVLAWLRAHRQAPSSYDVWLGQAAQDPYRGDVGGLAKIITEHYGYTVVDRAGELLQRAARNRTQSPQELREEVVALLDELNPPQRDGVPAREVLDRLQKVWDGREKPKSFVRTGLAALDEKLDGFYEGQLVVTTARPSMGKTSVTVAILNHIAVDCRIPTLVWTLEDGEDEYVQRLVGLRARMDTRILRREVSAEYWPDLSKAAGEVSAAPIEFFSRPGQSAADVRAKVQQMRAKGFRFVVVDQLSRIRHPPKNSDASAIQASAGAFKDTAREFSIPINLVHQLNRGVEERRDPRPRMDDLKGAAIEEDADVIIAPFRPVKYRDNLSDPFARNLCEVHILKHRMGPTGVVRCSFDDKWAGVRDRTRDEREYDEEMAEKARKRSAKDDDDGPTLDGAGRPVKRAKSGRLPSPYTPRLPLEDAHG